jgi:hypothetical protein
VSTDKYRVTVTRDGLWWVAAIEGAGLPGHGKTARSRSIANLDKQLRALFLLMPSAGGSMAWQLDYQPSASTRAKLTDFRQSAAALLLARHGYVRTGHDAAVALAGHGATIRDIAAIAQVSYLSAARLLALRPPVAALLRINSTRCQWVRGLPGAVKSAATNLARLLRVIVADAVRKFSLPGQP